MTYSFLRVPAIALGMAVSLSALSIARADTSGPPSSPSAAAPSLSEPAPTPGWAEAGPTSSGNAATAVHHRPHAYMRHHAWRNRQYYVRSSNPVADAATGVVGSAAELGSLAAYPIYCFPRYGSCPVYWPYR